MERLAAFFRGHPDALASLGLLILPFVVLAHAFLPGKVMSPADNVFGLLPWAGVHPGVSPTNPMLSEITLLFHPATMHAADEIRSGHFPLWNPHTFGGAPFFANPQTAVLFPLTALAYIFPYSLALTLMSVLKLSTAGVAMYWFLRRLDVGRFAAVIAGVTFAFNALLITWLQWSYASAVILLPALFAMTDVLTERRSARAAAGLALIVALALFAGYPQRVLYWLVLLAVWAVYRARTQPHPVRALACWTAGITLGLLLAAVQLLPFAEYTLSSAVLAYRREWMIYFPLPLRAVIAVFMPYFFGSPTGKDFWGPPNFNEISASVGVVPWLVMPVTLVAAWSRSGTKYFAALMTLSAALVYGVPLVGAALARVPPLDTTIAARNADLVVFAVTVLCGLGLDAAARLQPPARRAAALGLRVAFTVLTVTALCVVGGYYALAALRPASIPLWAQYLWLLLQSSIAAVLLLRLLRAPAGARRLWIALGAVQLAGLLPLAMTYNPVVDARLLDYSPPPVMKHLQARTALDGGRVTFSAIGGANLSTIFNLFEFGGYDGMTPRYVEQLTDPVGSLESYASGALRVTVDVTSPVFDLLGIRYVVMPPGSTSAVRHFTLDYQGPDAVVYRNDRALPRVFVVFRARTCLDDATALALIQSGGVDFRQEVVIAGCRNAPTPDAAGPSDAQIKAYADDRVVIAATTDAAGYLVLSDAWFPGWRVWVDGVEQTVWRANHALRAVWLPAGRHDVEFRYVPAAFRWGLLATALATVALVGLVWRRNRRIIAGMILLLTVGMDPRAADAKLAAAPFRLDASPAALTEGESVTIALDPLAPGMSVPGVEPYNIYISMSAESESRRGWLFMAASGGMSTTAAPFRRTITGTPPDGLKATVRSLPAGYYAIRAQFVRTSAAAPTRKYYAYQPLWSTIRVNPRPSGGSNATPVLTGLGVALLAALIVVWLPMRT